MQDKSKWLNAHPVVFDTRYNKHFPQNEPTINLDDDDFDIPEAEYFEPDRIPHLDRKTIKSKGPTFLSPRPTYPQEVLIGGIT